MHDVSTEGTCYSKGDSINCYTIGKSAINIIEPSDCSVICEQQFMSGLCYGFLFNHSNCELCYVCPETTSSQLTPVNHMFFADYNKEFDKGEFLLQVHYLLQMEGMPLFF